MFTKIKEVKVVDEARVRELESELKELGFKLDEKELDIKNLKAELESKEKILRNEIAMEISKATVEKDAVNYQLKQQNAVLLKEVEILEKAFENMGFDVKDMKEILNKLVDGIVSKNEINVIK